MREISAQKISDTLEKLCLEANRGLTEDLLYALNEALAREESPTGREIIRQILTNAHISKTEKLPPCQDTGLAVVFVELGAEVKIADGNLVEAINQGVSRGYHSGFFRKSVVEDPLIRKNTGDNTPVMLHVDSVPGEKITIKLMAKGGGAENRSAIRMFKPATSQEEIGRFIVETAVNAGPDACPPLIVGVGLGGNFDHAPLLAKKALLRKVGQHHSNPATAQWEKELLTEINKSGVGPMGLGGRITALAVNIERYPCHISSLPVAVNIECHAHRVREATI